MTIVVDVTTESWAAMNMEISRGDSRPPAAGLADYFTGDVQVRQLFGANDHRNVGAGQVTFTACARSAWHTHPAGQTLVVTSGTGWVQEWGGDKRPIDVGDVIWTPPGVKHWHGATPDGAMTHIAITGVLDGNNVEWMEKVTDDEYLA